MLFEWIMMLYEGYKSFKSSGNNSKRLVNDNGSTRRKLDAIWTPEKYEAYVDCTGGKWMISKYHKIKKSPKVLTIGACSLYWSLRRLRDALKLRTTTDSVN